MQSSEQIVKNNALIIGIVAYACAVILYSLHPNEANDGTTAWLFTIHIPIIVGGSVFCLVYFSLHNNLSRRPSLVISSLIIVLILRGHQFGTLNPIGPDGWFFAELSQRYVDFGPNPTINSYLARPGSLVPLLIVSYLIPGMTLATTASLFCLISTFILSYVILSASCKGMDELRYLPILATGVAASSILYFDFMQYSAQALGLIVMFWLLHCRLETGSHRDPLVIGAISFICFTHLIAPVLIAAVLFIEGTRNDSNQQSARILAIITTSIWVVYHLGPAGYTIEGNLARIGRRIPSETLLILPIIMMVFYVIQDQVKWTWNGTGRHGVDTKSLFFGVLILLPIMVLRDIEIGEPRFISRVPYYFLIPICRHLLAIPEMTGFETLRMSPSGSYAIVLAALIVGSMMAVAHGNLVTRSIHMPNGSETCWESFNEQRLSSIKEDTTSIVLHSPQLVPPIDDLDLRWRFMMVGDSSPLFEMADSGAILNHNITIVASLDMESRLQSHSLDALWDSSEIIAEGPCPLRRVSIGDITSL